MGIYICTKNFKFYRRGLNKDKIDLFDISISHYKVLMNDIDDFLKNNESLINILKDGYNLLETDCIEMRYYITLGTYCDDLCTGIKGVGFSFIKEKIVNKGMK